MKSKTQVRLNLTLEKDFHEVIKQQAESNYLKVTAFIMQHLKKTLLNNNADFKSTTQNERNM